METSLKKFIINFSSVLCESRRLIKSKPRQFLALGFLFLLPPIITANTVAPRLQSLFFDTVSATFLYPKVGYPVNASCPLLLAVAFLPFNLTLYLCAVGSVTYTAFHGDDIKLKSALISATTSFFPLLFTTLLAHEIIFLLTVFFVLVIGVAWRLGFQMEALSPFVLVFVVSTLLILLVLVVIHLQVNWTLASVVVVAESTWGFEALDRSHTLIKGRRWLAFSLSPFFWFLYGVFSYNIYYSPPSAHSDGYCDEYWEGLVSFLSALVTSNLQVIVKLCELAAHTSLYVHCKAEKIGGDNVKILAVDHDGKVSDRVVYVSSVPKLDACNH